MDCLLALLVFYLLAIAVGSFWVCTRPQMAGSWHKSCKDAASTRYRNPLPRNIFEFTYLTKQSDWVAHLVMDYHYIM